MACPVQFRSPGNLRWAGVVARGARVARFAIVAALGVCLALGSRSEAAERIDVGIHDLLPDTADQVVTLLITDGEESVRGMNVRAQLGDGLGPLDEPIFVGADFTGGIWDAYPTTTLGGPVMDAEQFLQASVNFSDVGVQIVANGVVVKLLVSTLGIFEGIYDLTLQSETIGESTDLIRPGGSTFVPELVDGKVRIVPEPASALSAMMGLAAILLATLRRRRLISADV